MCLEHDATRPSAPRSHGASQQDRARPVPRQLHLCRHRHSGLTSRLPDPRETLISWPLYYLVTKQDYLLGSTY
jgi:hypothetical protein